MDTILSPHESRFYIETEKYRKPEWKENTWSYTKVKIFDRETNTQIGEYIRNYSSNKTPFFPFKRKDGKWFALYSESYHRTYVMSLPECEKVAECNTMRHGNLFDTSGFCPYDYYVPFIKAYEMDQKEIRWMVQEEIDEPYDELSWNHVDLGFVLGCYWGGIHYIGAIDLTKIETGIVDIYFPFNPAEVPNKVKDFSQVIDVCVLPENGEIYSVAVNTIEYDYGREANKVVKK